MRDPGRWKTSIMLIALSQMLVMIPPLVEGGVLVEVDGMGISDEEIDRALGARLAQLKEQTYSLRKQQMQILINDRLIANESARRGVSVAALLDAEVTAKVHLVTEQELETANTEEKRLQPGGRDQLRAQLQMQMLSIQREKFLNTLRSQAVVKVYLEPPPVFRVSINVNDLPFKGSATAAVTIVKFEDFHCPYCKGVQALIAELIARYGDKVRVAHRDFPLAALHPNAHKAHEAARCAHEQGQFWAYHDALYANAPASTTENLNTYARDTGLDLSRFEHCMKGNTYHGVIQNDIDQGRRLGVTGTPTFFINGRELTGAHPIETLVEIVDDELSRTQSPLAH